MATIAGAIVGLARVGEWAMSVDMGYGGPPCGTVATPRPTPILRKRIPLAPLLRRIVPTPAQAVRHVWVRVPLAVVPAEVQYTLYRQLERMGWQPEP